MTEKIACLLIIAMAGLLAARLWTLEPVDRQRHAQEDLVERMSALTFH